MHPKIQAETPWDEMPVVPSLLILHIDTSWRAVKPAEVSVHYYSSIDTVYHMLDSHDLHLLRVRTLL